MQTTKQIFETAPSRARRIVKKGDIIISTVRPNLQGFAKINNDVKDLIVSTGFSVLTPTKCNGDYLFAYVFSQSITKQFYKLIVGSNYPAVNSSDVGHLKIALPPLPEQQKIAEILSVWDSVIEKQSALIEKFETRKRGLMQQLLTCRGDSHSPSKRLKGFSGEWKRVKLSEIVERITTKNTEKNKDVVTICAQRGFVKQTDFFSKTIASEVLDNYYIISKDSFCYNKSYCNGYPMGAIKRLKDFDKAVVTTLYICFKLIGQKTDIDFFEQFCEAGLFNQPLAKVANEGGRAHGLLNVTPEDFFNLRLRFPSVAEQTAIAEILITADNEIALAKQKLESLRQQKKGLMQVLLTGKKRVKYK